jgi:hypothetical protein
VIGEACLGKEDVRHGLSRGADSLVMLSKIFHVVNPVLNALILRLLSISNQSFLSIPNQVLF